MAQDEEPEFSATLICDGSNAELIGSLSNSEGILSPKGSYEKSKKLSLSPFCLSSGGRMHFFFQEGGLTEARDETASAMWDGACDSDARALREGGTTEGRSVRNGATPPA